MEITAILLAAGSGSRFGGDKLLHPLDDGVAIGAHAARNLVAAGLAVVAVVKAGDFPLADMLEQEGCNVTMFADAARGMGASLAHGVAQRRGADGWIIALADMPLIKPATIAAIARELEAGRAARCAGLQRAARPSGGLGQAIRCAIAGARAATPARATSSPRTRLNWC